MKILAFTAGAAQMYCGSCIRDNALAAELKAQGHDIILLPIYTPTLTDETNVAAHKVFAAKRREFENAATTSSKYVLSSPQFVCALSYALTDR